MLPRIRILQIGDVHLPSSASTPVALDVGDQRFPPQLKNIIARNPLKTVFRRVYELLASKEINGLLFMGDLTDRGNLAGYTACAKFIANSLQIAPGQQFASIPVGIVPGNHDVDRQLARNGGYTQKFATLNAALQSQGLPPLPIYFRPLSIESSTANATVHLMNSCWGCGAEEYIPDAFRTQITSALDSALAGPDAARAKAVYYDRQLDTPAFDQNDMSSLIQHLSSPAATIAVIVAHHNLLPQRVPRLAPYTELVNSGALRSSLLELSQPCIYLHGHIHDDPIEIIRRHRSTPLVSISAPEVTNGFNMIDLTYTTQLLPLSVTITPHRFDASGIFKSLTPIIIDVLGNRRRSANPHLHKFYSKLLDRGEMYWDNALALCLEVDPLTTPLELAEMIELLSADDTVLIENRDLPVENWIVRPNL